tara:strand:- start:344 stop:556 length:213 start_codon:yes stop_codon:yes gene_type:complete
MAIIPKIKMKRIVISEKKLTEALPIAKNFFKWSPAVSKKLQQHLGFLPAPLSSFHQPYQIIHLQLKEEQQ